MKLKQLLSWRFSLIFFHRWLGILIGLMFVAWCISGFILMYAGIPHLSAAERLLHLPVLNAEAIRVSPAQALAKIEGQPFRLRISMHDARPVYRINTGAVFGQWTLVYADTGEALAALDQTAAMSWLAGRYPEHTATLEYRDLLTGPDLYTHSPALQNHFPMHRIALGDASNSVQYVSAGSGETVMLTTRNSRFLGLLGYNLHTLFFFRQASWWSPLLNWLGWTGLIMTILGLVLGIWRFSTKPVHVKRGIAYRTPYIGWWKWHHYTGLVVGIMMLLWMFSGLASMGSIPGIAESFYTPAQMQAGARTVQGFGAATDYAPLEAAGIRRAISRLGQEFPVKELELQYVNGAPYFLAYQAPRFEAELNQVPSRSAMDFLTPALEREHLYIAADGNSAPFADFPENTLLAMAAVAMPGLTPSSQTWLAEPDAYYYHTLDSFDLGLPRTVRSLPVLQLKYDDPQQTWLYLTPSHAQLIKAEAIDRINRWAYYGLHGLDLPGLFGSGLWWDVLMLVLLAGALGLSVTTLVPMYQRLKRHLLRYIGSSNSS